MMKLPTISTLSKVKAVHALVACGVICTAVVIWYFVFSLPAQHQAELQAKEDARMAEHLHEEMLAEKKLKAEEERRELNIIALDKCFENAHEDYLLQWEGECETRGLGTDCSLPLFASDRLNDNLKEKKEICLKVFN